jgi:hypothetical protein
MKKADFEVRITSIITDSYIISNDITVEEFAADKDRQNKVIETISRLSKDIEALAEEASK